MRNISEIIKKARELKQKGFTTGEIADELNVSRETALWLVTHSEEEKDNMPRDIFIDWQRIGSNPLIIKNMAVAMSTLIEDVVEEKSLPRPEVIVGIAVSGVPLAAFIAEQLGAALAVMRPKKHLWEPEKKSRTSGFLLSNFSEVTGKNVVIVDDIATTGNTIRDSIRFLQREGAKPLAAVVLIDKKGLKEVDGRPVRALVSIGIVKDLGK